MLAINDTKVRVKYIIFMISLFSDSLVGGLKDSAKDGYESVKWEHSGGLHYRVANRADLFQSPSILFFLICMKYILLYVLWFSET